MKQKNINFVMITEEIVKTRRSTIQPFTERPGLERDVNMNSTTPMNASDLFSKFTADIIKEEVIFTR